MERKHMEDFHDIFSYEQYLDTIIRDLVNALYPFAEEPSTKHDNFPCHSNINTRMSIPR